MVRRACRAGSCRAWGGVPRPSNLLFVFRRLAVADEARPRKLHPRLDRQSFGSRRIRQSGTGNGGRHSSTRHQKHTAMKESVPRHRVNIGPLSERPTSSHRALLRFAQVINPAAPALFYSKVEPWHRLLRARRKRPRGRAAEQCDELAAAHYSITSSTLASSCGGTSRPSALAVCRLMTNSNFVDCSTGRSAGLAPLRI